MKDKGRNRDMKIGIANDHSAVDMKNEIVEYLESLGYEVVNYGTDSYESCNYPEFGEKIGNAVASGERAQRCERDRIRGTCDRYRDCEMHRG